MSSEIAVVQSQVQQEVRRAFSEIVARLCVHRYGCRLRAIVLTGSLARNEAAILTGSTFRRVLGDADVLLVFDGRQPSASQLFCLSSAIEAALEARSVRCHVSLGPVQAKSLSRMPPHIFGYELRWSGEVIWGDRGILDAIRPFPASAIPREDAWRLLCNRLIESIRGDDGEYSRIKLYLDMTTSYLLFVGAYQPSYRERADALNRLAAQPNRQDHPFRSLRAFADRVQACTEFKLTGYGATPDTSEALSDARSLWRWELSQLAGCCDAVSDDELMGRWADMQPFRVKLRGWLVVLRRRGWHRSWRDWPHWLRLAGRGSPRYHVYRAAALACFYDTDSRAAQALLPVRHQPGLAPGRDELAAGVVWNYENLLLGTRA